MALKKKPFPIQNVNLRKNSFLKTAFPTTAPQGKVQGL